MAETIAIVAEDRLTEAVLRKCVSDALPSFKIVRSEVKNGRGNVQREINAYANLAKALPVLVGVDLDSDPCPQAIVHRWAPDRHPNLIIRIATREIESWVLADRKRIARLINANSDNIPMETDLLEDPKRFFLDLVRQFANAELKRDLIPRNYGQYPRIGPAYNIQMCKFVATRWRPSVAAKRSESLKRAMKALGRLDPLRENG